MKKLLLFIFPLLVLFANAAMAQTPQYFVGNNAGGNSIPIGGSSWANQRCDLLWLPGEFGAPPIGFITKIYFRASGSVASTFTDFQIDIGQSNITSLSTATWQPGLTTAFQSVSHTITPVSGQWFEIALQTPVFFDPTLSLIVNTRQTATSGGIPLKTFTPSSGNRRAWGAYAAANPASTDAAVEYDFGFDLIPGFPCTGVPVTALAGPNEICPMKPFSVSFTTFYTGVNRQWQTSPDGVNWTNFTGTLNPTTGALQDAINKDTWYRCIITCLSSGQTYTTPAKLVKISPFYYCYCEGSKATGTAGMDIGNLKVATLPGNNIKLDNGAGGSLISNTGANKTYSDFRYTLPPVPMYRDSTYKFTVQQISSAAAFAAGTAAIYIDYNRNGTFEVFERAMLKTTVNLLPEPGIVRDTFQVPPTAEIGITGMRVILRSGTTAPDTCTSYTEGETEDYLVDLRYEPCTGPLNAGTISVTDTTMCPGYVYSIADTTHERLKSEINWLWQYSPDGLVWANLPNSANKDTFNNIMFTNTIYYRMRAVCEATQDTTYTAAQRIGLKPAYKCYCYSQAVGGPGVDTSDIGGFGFGNFQVTNNGPHLINETAFYARQDYTDMPPPVLTTGKRYQALFYHTMPGSIHADAKITLFMDFDNNKKYDIPAERVGTWFTSVNDYTIVDSIMIPDSVIVNVPTGMRVILNNNVGPNTPSDNACGVYTSGETEDFIVMFRREFPVNIENIAGMRDLGLYPNPTSGKFRIQFSGERFDNLDVTVRTVTGQTVLQHAYSHHGGQFNEELDMSGMAKGVYFVELKANSEKTTLKLVVR